MMSNAMNSDVARERTQLRHYYGLLKFITFFVLPRVPIVLKVVVFHLLGSSETSQYLDLRSDVAVAFLRSLLSDPKPPSMQSMQVASMRASSIKGRIWTSQVVSQTPPETSVRDELIAVVEGIRPRGVEEACKVPDLVPVEAEWVGYRPMASRRSRLPTGMSEAERYLEMTRDVQRPTTILYFHGGAYYLMDPATHRPLLKKLAKMTGGRVYSVRYRLCPQHPFPSALLDAFVSYLALLYPPPDAIHEAVSPSNIVFAGDSAGGHLSLCLLQLLLELCRRNSKITWFGVQRAIPLPAGVSVNSPWIDISQSFPSWKNNQRYDYLPSPAAVRSRGHTPDAIWPATPPRRHMFAQDPYLSHPLACLQLAQSWVGSPPIYICTGWECLADEDRCLAGKLVRDGVRVVFEEYEAMPHCFAAVFPKLRVSWRCFEGWSGFIRKVSGNDLNDQVSGEGGGRNIESKFTLIKARTGEEIALDPDALSQYDDEDLHRMAHAAIKSLL